MRRRRSGIGRAGQFVLALLVLFVAIAVVIGAGQSLWALAQDFSERKAEIPAKKDTKITVNTEAVNESFKITEIPIELLELLERNPDAEEFVLSYPLKKNQEFEIDLTEHLNSETLPLFLQWDERWGYTVYGSNVMGLTGCGPTCLSMVCLHLLQDANYTPRYVADFAEENGYYVEGSGSAWTLISEGGETLGLDITEIPLDENRMMKNLELKNPIICIMGPGDFTTAGHFIVLAGCKDGKFVVNDPNSITNSERLWSYDELKGQIKNLWVCRLSE